MVVRTVAYNQSCAGVRDRSRLTGTVLLILGSRSKYIVAILRFLSEPDIQQGIDQVGSNILLCIRRRLGRGKDRRASHETIEYLLTLFAQVVTQYVISFSNLVRVTQVCNFVFKLTCKLEIVHQACEHVCNFVA
jgi:hypothetical protein